MNTPLPWISSEIYWRVALVNCKRHPASHGHGVPFVINRQALLRNVPEAATRRRRLS